MAARRNSMAPQASRHAGSQASRRSALGAAVVLVAGGVLLSQVAFVQPSLPSAPLARGGTARYADAKDVEVQTKEGLWTDVTDPYQAQNPNMENVDPSQSIFAQLMPEQAQREALAREVEVTDIRDINALLKLPNPLRPTLQMQLAGITMSDGEYIAYPKVEILRRLNPTRIRPITFHWLDKTQKQTKAPRQYDEIIQRLLNAGPADMEDLVRANWQQFDKAFFFRLSELKSDADDTRLKEKITNLERLSLDVIKAAQEQTRKTLPEAAEDARAILDSMLEPDGDTLLWPPPPDAYARLAETITTRATRNKYEDGWFETMLEIVERFGSKMQVQDKSPLLMMAQVCAQRLTTEWMRNDALWEETDEGKFIFRLMSISHEQWAQQLFLEQAPLDSMKLREELKIISENKVMALPMGSKLQTYAAKYIQGLVEFVEGKDELLAQRQAAR